MLFSLPFLAVLLGALAASVVAHPDPEWYRRYDLMDPAHHKLVGRAPELASASVVAPAAMKRRSCSGRSRHRAGTKIARLNRVAETPVARVAIDTSTSSTRQDRKITLPERRKHKKHDSAKKSHRSAKTHKKYHSKPKSKPTTKKHVTSHKVTHSKKKEHHSTHKAIPKHHTTEKKHPATPKKHHSDKAASSGTNTNLNVKISSGSGKGLFGVSSSQCGASGATQAITDSSGPNGAESWLNCGLSKSNPGSGWTPPYIQLSQIRVVSLDDALQMPNSVYSACKPYVQLFDKWGAQLGLPPILLAAIAMQESSCNAGTMGDQGGAWGLMQITSDKCGGAPSAGCADPDYNIMTGAKYLKGLLDQQNGDVLVSLGMYNGWYKGLTYNGATAIRNSCFVCQNDLDYHQKLLNGWLQGIDGSKLGTIHNIY